ncbi:hypothetical protein IFM89_026889 [Coptis chinensis]|uniref:Anaphase-promoting complex subunit 5 n=1 Tax=Coptis chinensis TaxID=261450 RepID=A0A835LIT5_9MAGN|nr:hypothetical protein IFM89_026889 [Coptis chinensis]
MPVSCGVKARDDCRQGSLFAHHLTDALRADDHRDGMFLRTNWQVQGYLREQADLIEKHASSFPLSAFEAILKQLQRLAPELHRVHYLRYLNSLYHDDYPASIENLHSYFDYSAGEEGVDIAPSSSPSMSFGKYETALLCLGMMHSHFGHPKQALEHVKRSLLSFGPKSSTKLRTCPSNVIKVGVDGAAVTVNGAFSSAWLKNLRKPNSSSVLLQGNELGSGCESFHFGGQPSPIPGSLLQLSGSSYSLWTYWWCNAYPLQLIEVLVDANKVYPTEAFSALKVAEDKFLSVTKSGIQMLKLLLLHDRALHQGQLKLAQRVCDEFGVLASSISGVDMGVKTEACLRHSQSVAHSLFCMCYKFNLQVEHAISLLLLAEIHKKAGNAVLGISYALASLSFCQSLNLDLLEASTTLMLGELWLSLGSNHAKRALNLVHKALPMIFGHGGLELRA